MRLRIPFQFKIYALIFLLFAGLMYVTMLQINRMISKEILEEEKSEFKGHKIVFYNLLDAKVESLRNEALLLSELNSVQNDLLHQDGEFDSLDDLQALFPRIRRWPVILIADSSHKILGGRVLGKDSEKSVIVRNPGICLMKMNLRILMWAIQSAVMTWLKMVITLRCSPLRRSPFITLMTITTSSAQLH